MGKRVAVIGECMLELQGGAFGPNTLGYGGDTLNTAVYLRRFGAAAGIEVTYATALGDDALSDGLLAQWADQGLETGLVRRLPGRLPGLYMIVVDPTGERSFHYWRDSAAAKAYFEVDQTPLEAQADDLDALYLSGISLAILPPEGRQRLFALMRALRARGAAVVFDNNYRPRLWPDRAEARRMFTEALSIASIGLVTADDHQALFELPSLAAAIASAQELPPPELLIKRGAASTLVRAAEGTGDWLEAPTEPVAQVIDTTAAGDSFAGGYLARRLAGEDARSAARFGNRVAARVIQHRGAIVPAQVMVDLTGACA
ncbi:sugar kinase [Roseateles amylovorans]|uniref:Sugar kinase n=1 Tax=Roseateles amylovorans TaxID=2978473 RepID=A0ABY6AVQ7_9BURK|nr:sugar kinase [Roseateles amylovorans]UXH77276.1 sugar kinase [Roseateles amylovorans]